MAEPRSERAREHGGAQAATHADRRIGSASEPAVGGSRSRSGLRLGAGLGGASLQWSTGAQSTALALAPGPEDTFEAASIDRPAR